MEAMDKRTVIRQRWFSPLQTGAMALLLAMALLVLCLPGCAVTVVEKGGEILVSGPQGTLAGLGTPVSLLHSLSLLLSGAAFFTNRGTLASRWEWMPGKQKGAIGFCYIAAMLTFLFTLVMAAENAVRDRSIPLPLYLSGAASLLLLYLALRAVLNYPYGKRCVWPPQPLGPSQNP